MKILAIETSCDETACAIVEDGTKILSNVIASSTEMHKKYGGIVPEIAAREQLACIIPTIKESLEQARLTHDDIDEIAVTVGPGLIGSLLVGVESAKTIAYVKNKPIIPVNHVLAHMYANFVSDQQLAISHEQKNENKLLANSYKLIAFPTISLVVSGGHTELFLMKTVKDITWLGGTLDDAAGEAFDKSARLLGFGTGGGPAIQEAAKKFIVHSSSFMVKLPRPMIHDETLNFSFSGLKTAVMREWKKVDSSQLIANEFAHEIQEAITDVLVNKTMRAAQMYNAKSILLSGGVAANTRLREKLSSKLLATSYKLFAPPVQLCTDNAVYIAAYAYFMGKDKPWQEITATPDLSVEL